MIVETGILFLRRTVDPTIYFILVDAYIYIGETMSFPAQRWGAHVAPGGSLRQKLSAIDTNYVDWWEPLRFISFSCAEELSDVKDSQKKTALKAVEHQVHCDLGSRPSQLIRRVEVISDTEKTAPRFWRDWESTRIISHRIIEGLALVLENEDG